ncbi:MAG: hypothetical protein JOY68_07255 [Candidatus Dormibacteraeota bacterium]|nr:hypothetical protein [Candidatus Dormibacteraeota bacterium]
MQSLQISVVTALLPQILMLGLAVIIAVLGVLRPAQRADLYRWIAVIALLAAIIAASILLWALRGSANGVALAQWNGGLVVDRFSLAIVIVASMFALVCCLLLDTYLRRLGTRSAAFFAIVLLATAAVATLAAQREMMSLFAAFIVLLVALSALPAVLKTDSGGVRVASALLIEGGVAGAALLYGSAIIYGVSGTTSYGSVSAAVQRGPAVVTLGGAFILFGLAFMLGLPPLRRWTERAVDDVPAVPVAFMTVMAMTGGAAALLRADAAGLESVLRPTLGVGTLAVVLTLLLSSGLALQERSLGRLIVIAGMGQAALLLLAVIGFGSGGVGEAPSAMLFALLIFGLSSIAAFSVLAMLQAAGLAGTLDDLRGLGRRSPAAAVFLACALLTLAGVPPFGGFVARFIVVISAFDSGYAWVAVIAIATSAITAIPLVRIVAGLWAEQGEEQPFTLFATPRLGRMVAGCCCLGAFYLTVLAQPLLVLARGGAGSVH